MSGTADGAIALSGRGRVLGPSGSTSPAGVSLTDDGWTVTLADGPRAGAYRDLATIAVQDESALLVIGDGLAAERVLLDQFGASLGRLVRELRDRRLRQRASDAFITLPADEAIVLVQAEAAGWQGVAQLAYDPWGAVLAPLDERHAWIRIRRSRIAGVTADVAAGTVAIECSATAATGVGLVRLIGLGAAAGLHGGRLDALRAAALADAARIVGGLIPDAAYGQRAEASRLLVDGTPARPADLPTGWGPIETGVLVDPTFAATYATLRDRAGALAEERAIAIAPTEPGGDDSKTWFLVPLPGNLVALELVSEGAHATYLFRAQPRSEYTGGPTDPTAARRAVEEVSEALVDCRFLREPMALPDDVLSQPRYLRYRLALAALPSLAAARARFVARLVHGDDAAWTAALHDLIAWHTAARDEAASWPGRAAQEALVGDAAETSDGGTT